MAYHRKRWQRVILVSAGIAAAGLVLYLLALKKSPSICIFYRLTGLYCPGCGNTRAAFSLLHLDLAGMLRWNLLFPLEAGYLLWIYLVSVRRYLKTGQFSISSPLPVLDGCFLAVLIGWTVLRNILHI